MNSEVSFLNVLAPITKPFVLFKKMLKELKKLIKPNQDFFVNSIIERMFY